MGATYRSAKSIGLIVLLAVIALAPIVSASEVQTTIEDTAAGARGSAQQGQTEAQREAESQKEQAEQRLVLAQEKAEAQTQNAENFAMTVLASGLAAVENARATILSIADNLPPIPVSMTGGPPASSGAGFRAESSEYALVRPSITAPLMWVTASVSGLVVLLVAARKLIGFGAIPLLSRIAHSDIYNNDARRTIHELVVGEPGQCLNELVGRTGYSRNAVSYHLFVLEKEEEIVSVKDGKYRRYFTRNGKYVNGAKNVVAALRNETTLKLAKVVMERPGAIQRDLCVELGATPSATCWHAKRLLDLGVIRKERVANTVKYYPGEAMSKYDLSDMGLPRLDLLPAPAPATVAMG
jgi:predicted transcriptional regulator